MSMAQSGNTDICVMDIRTRRTQRITGTPGIDTGASCGRMVRDHL